MLKISNEFTRINTKKNKNLRKFVQFVAKIKKYAVVNPPFFMGIADVATG